MPSSSHSSQLHLVAVLDNIRSLYNVGAIFRTADGLGVEHLYLTGMTGRPDDPLTRTRIAKTALGAEESVPWTYIEDPVDAVMQLQTDGYLVLALEQTPTSVDLFSSSSTRNPARGGSSGGEATSKIALVVGHEVYGVCEPVLAAVDHVVELPMLGSKESFNVSIAFGIAASWLRFGSLSDL
jgi:tRNA G18 (ribose-2'-O)-methylase SpoU